MATKAINTLTVKTAGQMAASDYFVGHDNADPAAFRGRLDELAEFLGGRPELVAALSAADLTDVAAALGLPQRVHFRVASNGGISNAPGQLTVSGGGAPVSGVYTHTAPTGWVWFSAVGGGISMAAVRIVQCNRSGASLTTRVVDGSGAAQSVEHWVTGLLIPA